MNKATEPATLFRPQNDSEYTQMTFALKFFPMLALSESRRRQVIFNRFEWMTKMQIEELCNEEKNILFFQAAPGDDEHKSRWNIVWTNNNMPSELDWIRTEPTRTIFVEFRVTRRWGRVAILSFTSLTSKSGN